MELRAVFDEDLDEGNPILVLTRDIAEMYARALIAIARGDGEISFEEGLRLEQRIISRCGIVPSLADLLLAPPVTPDELAGMLGAGGPFCGGVQPGEIAEALITDGAAIVLAKGHISQNEAVKLRAFGRALGMSDADFARVTAPIARWLPR